MSYANVKVEVRSTLHHTSCEAPSANSARYLAVTHKHTHTHTHTHTHKILFEATASKCEENNCLLQLLHDAGITCQCCDATKYAHLRVCQLCRAQLQLQYMVQVLVFESHNNPQ